MKIDSHDKHIDELLKANVFKIPRFQRPYSWEADHVSEFWSDVIENLGGSYFIGSMVVYKVGRDTLAVVDGQQRLTTITILLCAIREALKEIGKIDLANGLQEYIEQKDREYNTVYVLQTETSFPYLQEEVLRNGKGDAPYVVGREEIAIERAFELFKGKIKDYVQKFLSDKEQTEEDNVKDATVWLSKLRDTVFDLNVILVTLTNEDDAYLIFETLNTRGKDLALSDLIRNHFSKFIKPVNGVDRSKLKWEKVLDTIAHSSKRLDPDTFIVHSWQSRYDYVTKAKTFQKAKARITKKNANSHLDRFVSDVDCWRSIFDSDYLWTKGEKSASRSLSALRTFKVVQPTPGLLSLIRAYRDKKIKLGVLSRAIANIEKFHFSFNAVTSSRSSGGISGMYSSFGRSVFAATDSNQVGVEIKLLTNKLIDRRVADSEFDAGFGQITFTNKNASQKGLVQYILQKLAIHEGQPSIGDSDDLTIEHLLPQSSSKNDEDEDVIGQIGNLILVDGETNRLLGTKSFKEKKKILDSKGYRLPKLLEEASKITPELISENTMRISEIAREMIWKI